MNIWTDVEEMLRLWRHNVNQCTPIRRQVSSVCLRECPHKAEMFSQLSSSSQVRRGVTNRMSERPREYGVLECVVLDSNIVVVTRLHFKLQFSAWSRLICSLTLPFLFL